MHRHSEPPTQLDFPMANLRSLALHLKPVPSQVTDEQLPEVLVSDGFCSSSSTVFRDQAGAPHLLEVWVIDFRVETQSVSTL